MTNHASPGLVDTLGAIGDDVRYAVRTLRREPGFAIGVVLTFALAIGANAATFGLVNRLMLAPPPGIRDAERVAHLRLRVNRGSERHLLTTTSYPVFLSLRGAADAFDGVAATRPETLTVGRGAELTQIAALAASGDFFSTLGTTPAIGRFFGPADDALPDGNPVAVLGHAYWRRAFGSDRGVLGQDIILDDRRFTIVGVAPRDFNGDALSGVDVFVPLTVAMGRTAPGWASNPYMNLVSLVARLRDGVAPEIAREMATAALGQELTAGRSTLMVDLQPIVSGRTALASPRTRVALWLVGVSAIVLLIATANVATLLALRATRRRRATAIRIAMGAGPTALARPLLVESVLLAATGCLAGLVLSRWFSDVVRATLLPELSAAESFVDRRVLLVSIAAACVAGIVAGCAPVLQVDRDDLSTELRAGGPGLRCHLTIQRTLVAVQVALCMVLLVGAALFVHSLQRVQAQDLGFSTEQLLHVTLEFPTHLPGVERDRAYDDALRRVRAADGVTTATAVAGIPFGPHYIPPVSVPGVPWPPDGVQIPIMYGATPEYLDVMDVRLVHGRPFTPRDGRGSPLVVLVNETMARTAWPDGSALGRCVRVGFAVFPPIDDENPAASAPCREVVGVVRDSRARSIRPEGNEDRIMQYYVPFEQLPESPAPDPARTMGLLVRVTGDVESAAARVQHVIQSGSARRLFARTRPYQDLIDPQIRSWRVGATLFSALGALALGIAAVGVFGVVSYVVTQRTRELGVRLALGGTAAAIGRLVIVDALRTVGLGLGAGVVVALALGPVLASLLFQTSAREPVSIVAAAAVLLTVACVAAARPAWRASRVPPVVALRAGE